MQYISHEARGTLQVANMGLELYANELADLERRILGSGSGSGSGVSDRSLYHAGLVDCQVQVHDIADACNAAQQTLNDLLTIGKIEDGMLSLKPSVIPVLSFVATEFKSYAIQARYKSIELEFNWHSTLSWAFEHMCIHADRHKLSGVIRNLMSNALKFTPEHGKISCLVTVMRHTGEWETRDDEDVTTTRKMVLKLPSAHGGPLRGSPVFGKPSIESTSSSTENYSGNRTSLKAVLENVSHRSDLVQGGGDGEPDVSSLMCRIEIRDNGVGISKVNIT